MAQKKYFGRSPFRLFFPPRPGKNPKATRPNKKILTLSEKWAIMGF
jgi:hypothetical protein